MRTKSHGLSRHVLYSKWANMMHRCYSEKNKRYSDWGGRGITVCNEWHDVSIFINDMYPTFKEGLSLDRINNQLGYSKDNCRWASITTQNRNTRLLSKANTSGYRCVYEVNKTRYRTQIKINGKKIHLGYFDTALEAAKAYDKYVIDNNLEHTRNLATKSNTK